MPSNEINLVIDSTGRGSFHIATKSPSSSTDDDRSHLVFDIQIDEPSQKYLIHMCMGRLDKIRVIHPGMNILRTLSYWNGLQKKRYSGPDSHSGENIRGGQLGIVAKSKRNMVMMTLMGDYVERQWEHDATFQLELERFVEDAQQFHMCLNSDSQNEDCCSPAVSGSGTDELSSTGAARKAKDKLSSFLHKIK